MDTNSINISKQINNIYHIIKELNLKINKKEDDIKHIINEKDDIINKMNIKILEQENIIKTNQKQISNLNIKINELINLLKNDKNENNAKIKNIDEEIIRQNYDMEYKLEQLKNNISFEKYILKQKDENYILLNVYINKENIGKDITILNQINIYKCFYNFESDDIDIIIDNEIIQNKYKYTSDYKYDEKSKNCEGAQYLSHKLNTNYLFYWNFTTAGMHIIKIKFKKIISTCKDMFSKCGEIINADLSNFNCSRVSSCENMFSECVALTDIKFGNLDFNSSTSFKGMFNKCQNLFNLDVSKFNTKNSLSFSNMFSGCLRIKNLDVSKFDSSKCEDIRRMFKDCQNIVKIDMFNWDMGKIKSFNYFDFTEILKGTSNLGTIGAIGLGVIGVGLVPALLGGISMINKSSGINELFKGCKQLKKIRMSTNFNNINDCINNSVFEGLPEYGSFIWKKGYKCEELIKHLPKNWKIIDK